MEMVRYYCIVLICIFNTTILDHVALHGNVQTFAYSFGGGNNSILLDDVICSGGEATILNCTFGSFFDHNCDHSEDAAVICRGQYKKIIVFTYNYV